jgi:hypothetical protein
VPDEFGENDAEQHATGGHVHREWKESGIEGYMRTHYIFPFSGKNNQHTRCAPTNYGVCNAYLVFPAVQKTFS